MKTTIRTLTERHSTSPAPRETRSFTSGWLFGTVLGLEPSRELLSLRVNETRRKETIRWAPQTQFTMDGHPATSADLRAGQRVRIHCRFANRELQADNVAIGRGDHPLPSPHPTESETEPPMENEGECI